MIYHYIHKFFFRLIVKNKLFLFIKFSKLLKFIKIFYFIIEFSQKLP